MGNDAWPDRWHSLNWLPLLGAVAVTVTRWGWERLTCQFDPHRKYPR